MSDINTSHPGTLSPRNVDTVRYTVVKPLPNAKMPKVGELLETWPQGEFYAFVTGVGLAACRNSDIAEWVAAGRLTPA